MDILAYLTELIATRKEVGVPGLGTFHKRKTPGRYDTQTHSFIPPSYVLDFSSEVQEQTVLKEFVSKKENIGIDNAAYLVDQFVTEIQEKLSNGQRIALAGLGILSNGLHGVVFNPQDVSNLGFDFYGMPDLKDAAPGNGEHISSATAYDVDDSGQVKVKDEQPVFEEISELRVDNNVIPEIDIETSEDMHRDEEDFSQMKNQNAVESPVKLNQYASSANNEQLYDVGTEEQSVGMPAYLKVIIAGSVVFAALIAAYLVKPELFERFNGINAVVEKSTPLTSSDQAKLDSAANADSLANLSAPQVNTTIDSLQDSVVTQQPDTAISYEIIAASLLNKKEADDFLRQMERKGIPAKIANMPGKRVKISIGTFTDEEEAKAQLKLLRNSTKIPGIYIYTNKHTNNTK